MEIPQVWTGVSVLIGITLALLKKLTLSEAHQYPFSESLGTMLIYQTCAIMVISLPETCLQEIMVVVFISRNKHPVQDDEYNYHDTMQVYLIKKKSHSPVFH